MSRSSAPRPAMENRRDGMAVVYAAIVAVWTVSVVLWTSLGYVRPDGAGYAAYLPSVWIDHDLLLFNEWARFGMIHGDAIQFTNVTPNGHLSDHWTIAPAVVWFPAFASGAMARAVLPGLQAYPANGLSLPYAAAIVTGSALAGLAVLLLGIRIAAPKFGRWAATLAAIGVWFGSPLMWYSLRHATMAHAVSAASCALIVAISLSLRETMTATRVFAAGLACGFAFAVRPQNLTLVVVPVIIAGVLPHLRQLGLAAIGFAIGALPELVVSSVLYGNPLAFASSGGANDWHPFERFHFWQLFGSWYHGMFPWTPLLAVALMGLVFLWREDRRLAAAGIVTFLLQWLIIGSLDRSFWGMQAFGQRRFDPCTIFFLIGLAALFARLPKMLAIVIASAGSAWTMLLYLAAGHLDLNRYIPAATLWRTAMMAFQHDHWIGILPSIAPSARSSAAIIILFATVVCSVVVLLAMRINAAVVAATYLLAVSALLLWCGSHDAARMGAFRSLQLANQPGSSRDGHALDYLGLLQNERDYFLAIGRPDEAARSEHDAESFARAHAISP